MSIPESPAFERLSWGYELTKPVEIETWLLAHLICYTSAAGRYAHHLGPSDALQETFVGQVRPAEIDKLFQEPTPVELSPSAAPVFKQIRDAKPRSPYGDYSINKLQPGVDEIRLYPADPHFTNPIHSKFKSLRYTFPFALLTESPLKVTKWRNNHTPLLAFLHHTILLTVRLFKKPSSANHLEFAPITETHLAWSPECYDTLHVQNPSLPASFQTFCDLWDQSRPYTE